MFARLTILLIVLTTVVFARSSAQAEKAFVAKFVVGPIFYPPGSIDDAHSTGLALDGSIGGFLQPGLALRIDLGLMQVDVAPKEYPGWVPFNSLLGPNLAATSRDLWSLSLTLVKMSEKRKWFDPYVFAGIGPVGYNKRFREVMPESGFMFSPGVGVRLGSSRLAATIEMAGRVVFHKDGLTSFVPVQFGLSYR